MMGLLSWLFPSTEDRIRRARDLVERERFADARLEVMDLEHPEAVEILERAERALTLLNLEEALSWGRAGDDRRVQMHLELAETFRKEGMDEDFRSIRRQLRELRAERRAEEQRDKQAREARLTAVDPLGLSGPSTLLQPPAGVDPLSEDAEEQAQRLALILENYPASLRDGLEGLGTTFSTALLDLEDGRPDLALPNLLSLPDDRPLVRWERARAAWALKDPAAAAREVRAFADLAGDHFDMGRLHSGAFLAQLTAEAGDVPGAIRVLRTLRVRHPRVGGVLLAQLLEATGELTEADALLRDQIKAHPKAMQLYHMLARVRVRGGDRPAAIQALEAAQVHQCASGRCGTVPIQPEMIRDLAILYFEEGGQQARAIELARQAHQRGLQPGWESAYLSALTARAEDAPDAPRIAEALRSQTPDGPLMEKVERYLFDQGPRPAQVTG